MEKPKRVAMNIYITEEMRDNLQAVSILKETSMASLVRGLIRDCVREALKEAVSND